VTFFGPSKKATRLPAGTGELVFDSDLNQPPNQRLTCPPRLLELPVENLAIDVEDEVAVSLLQEDARDQFPKIPCFI